MGVLLLTVSIAVGCGNDVREHVTIAELPQELPFSNRIVEVAELDFGAVGSDSWLTDGWSHIEQAGGGKGFRWSLGPSSGLTFNVVSSRDLELLLTAKSFNFRDGTSQTVDVLVNGVSVRTLPMTRRWAEYPVPVPAAVLRNGQNEIRFHYGKVNKPASPSRAHTSGPDRPLAVAWRHIRLSNARPTAAEALSLRGDSLFIPSGVRLEFFVKLPAGSSFRLDSIRPRGEAPGRLVIAAASDEHPESVLLDRDSSFGQFEIPILDGRIDAIRLSITVEPSSEQLAGAGFLLEGPRIVANMPAPEALARTESRELRRSRRPNIVLYLVDTLRTDAVGAYGSDRGTSPAFDRFVEDATLFENAVGQSSWTRASVASLFTGLLPTRHGAIDRLDILSGEAQTLPELLAAAGYETAAFITNPNVTGKFGFGQGFDEFLHIRTHRASDLVNQRVFGWLEQRSWDRPFFLYVHTMDPHHPYLPPESLRPAFAKTEAEMRAVNRLLSTTPAPRNLAQHVDRFRALYDGAALFNDRSFGELVEHLDAAQLLDETVVLFVSDHGEEFFEHGDWQHGKNLHAETLNVPLAIRFPDAGRGVRVPVIVGHVDLMPTLLEYLNLEPPEEIDGRSVLGQLAEVRTGASLGRAFAHLSLDGHESLAVVDDEWKLILEKTARGTIPKLYRWSADPEERADLAAEHPIRVSYLRSLIAKSDAEKRPFLAREEAEIDAELERSLKALGYLK